MATAIVLDGLTRDFGGRRALDNVSLHIERGEIFGFLGPNGAGKSTTIRVLLDFIRPTAGRASILGFDSYRQSREVHGVTGYLPGELRLYPGLTGQQHAGLVASMRGDDAAADVNELARILDLEMDRKVRVLSKGNRQKLGLLLALMGHPPVLLLDEPTSGLDPLLQHIVWDLLEREAARGTTVFFSSHVMGEVEQICQRVGILREGHLIAVESIGSWRARQTRHVAVTFTADAPPASAFQFPGVREIHRARSVVEFEVTDIDPLIKALARFHIADLRVEEPTLEELLLRYYREGAP